MRTYQAHLAGLILLSVVVSACSEPAAQEITVATPESGVWGQRVELPATGLTLRVPEDWSVYKHEDINDETGIVNTILTNGSPSNTSFRGDVIRIVTLQCASEQIRNLHMGGKTAQAVLRQEDARLIQDLPTPNNEGIGYEVEFYGKRRGTPTLSRAYIFQTINNDRCYLVALENEKDDFLRRRTTYDEILNSVEFASAPRAATETL